MAESKETLEILKIAKWNCDRKIRYTGKIDQKIKKISKKYKNNFIIEKNNFYAIGRYFTESMLRQIDYIEDKKNSKIFLNKLTTCSNCKKQQKCSEFIEQKNNAIMLIIDKYKNMSHKFINIELDDHEKKDFDQTVNYAIWTAIHYFDLKKKNKFSTYCYLWLKALITEFFNIKSTGKKKNNSRLEKTDFNALSTIDNEMIWKILIKNKYIKENGSLSKKFKDLDDFNDMKFDKIPKNINVDNDQKEAIFKIMSDSQNKNKIYFDCSLLDNMTRNCFNVENNIENLEKDKFTITDDSIKRYNLKKNEKLILNCLYNPHFNMTKLNNFEIRLLKEKKEYEIISKELNITEKEVKNIELKARKKIRNFELLYC